MLAGNIGIRVVGRNIDAAIAIKYGDQILVPAGFTKKVVKNMITVTLPCHGTMLEMVVLYL